MSATDVVTQPSGPNIQDIAGPNLEEPTLQALINSGPGPDGRLIGEDPGVAREEDRHTPSPVQAEIKVDIVTDKTESVPTVTKLKDTVNTEPVTGTDVPTEHSMEGVSPQTRPEEAKPPVVGDADSKQADVEKTANNQNQTKLGNSAKIASSEAVPVAEVPQSGPPTEIPARDGTKTPHHVEKERKEGKPDTDRDSSKTPFSVTAERKPLHTAQTRSHSDYYSKTPSSNRYAHIASSLGQFYGFVPDPTGTEHRFSTKMQRMRRPPKLVRLATVTMSPKTKPVPRGPSLYYEEPKKPKKVITWNEAMDARPPLRIDMEGPGPTQYSPRNRPLNETNSPAWTFGSKCFTEKSGGSRTSWEKTWFQTPEVWTSKVDFYNDSAWPTPLHYKARPMLGPRQKTMLEPPSFTIGTRKDTSLNKAGSDKEPSPADYDKDVADKMVLKKSPSFTHQFRREGTVIWASKEKVPGPGSYTPKFSYNKPHGPSFSIRSLRREKSHILGPFSTF